MVTDWKLSGFLETFSNFLPNPWPKQNTSYPFQAKYLKVFEMAIKIIKKQIDFFIISFVGFLF